MNSTSSHRWLLGAVAVALVLGAATYALRDHPTSVSFLRTLWPSEDAPGTVMPAADEAATSMDMAGVGHAGGGVVG